MKLLSRQLRYIIIRNKFTMIDLQRMSKDVIEHRYCVTEHISMKICRLFPLFIKISFKNVQSPMTSFCNNIILLVEFILQRFIVDIHIVWKSS